MSDKVTDSFNCNMRVLVLHIFDLDFQKLCVFPSYRIKWHSHSLQLTKGPAGSCVEKTQTESSMWCQYFIVVTYPADGKWQFAQAYEDIVLAAKKLSGILCQNLFIKFFLMYSGEACWACMLFFPPTSWKLASIQQLVVKCLVLSPFLPRCLQPVGRISVLFKMSFVVSLLFFCVFCLVFY